FNVSHATADRALAGLSMGGARVIHVLHNYPDTVGYYGIWSAGAVYNAPTAAQVPGIKQALGIQVGAGLQDFLSPPGTQVAITAESLARVAGYRDLGIAVKDHFLPGIHSWDIWRQELAYFLSDVAFQPVAGPEPENPLNLGATVKHTGRAPTGYEVTIRYLAPAASKVEVYGEWSFAAPVSGPGTTPLGPVHSGATWAAGDVPAGGSWAYNDMTGPDSNGVWTFTTPLPSGVFSYGILVDCPQHSGSCRVADPANLPWSNTPQAQADNAIQQTMSQVYVPTAPGFGTADYSYQGPATGPQGAVSNFTYASPASTNPAGVNYATVYTPSGYDPRRATPYPTLYIWHGGSGYGGTDWVTQGLAQNILDNAINSGAMEPVVAVFPNAGPLNGDDVNRVDLIDHLIPAIEDAYWVSRQAEDRGLTGLSVGGRRVYEVLENNADAFGYYGVWSMGREINPLTAEAKTKLASVKAIQFGAGLQDQAAATGVSPTPTDRPAEMSARAAYYREQVPGLNIVENYIEGVHSWDVWRQQLNFFVRDIAFQPAAGPEPENPLNLGATVKHTGRAPTGYEVTFRYKPSAAVTSVQLYGEWYFTQPSSITGLGDGDARPGKDWQPGDVPAGGAWSWGSEEMTLGSDGVWSYTMPLPSGTFSYRFYHDCVGPFTFFCTGYVDPTNVPWSNDPAVAAQGAGQQTMSQVYVPSSSEFPTYSNGFQAPVPAGAAASVRTFGYYPVGSTDPSVHRNATVVLPAGYDPGRAEPYPTFYLTHGGGGNDTDWATQGAAQTILANAIRDGATEPTVIVMPNWNPLPTMEGFAEELRDALIPAIEANFNVSHNSADRAFAGLSMGGARAVTILHSYTSLFGYYGIWSAGATYDPPDAEQVARMKGVLGIHIGAGEQDFLSPPGTAVAIIDESLARTAGYRALGLDNVTQTNYPGIHSWDIWRQELDYFLRNIAFTTPGTEPEPTPTVTVTAAPEPGPTTTVTAAPEPGPTTTVTAAPEPGPTVTETAVPEPGP
ncbi:MAG: hypothetical protein LBT54_02380, partial [Bifidobacteriaceae bacterium]|nr:hypothetical protein [Bifidobacteriaceae bacterium]